MTFSQWNYIPFKMKKARIILGIIMFELIVGKTKRLLQFMHRILRKNRVLILMEYGMINVLRSDEMRAYLEIETIQAAVAGEKRALDKVLEYYSPFLEEQATIEVHQPDGSVKKESDEDLKQELIMALLEAIPNFQMPSEGETEEVDQQE